MKKLRIKHILFALILIMIFSVFVGLGFNINIQTAYAEGHDHTGWTVWGDDDGEKTILPDEAGNYVLGGDITLSGTWNVPGTLETPAITNLCLNGHVIKLVDNSTESVISIPEYAELNLFDCDLDKDTPTTHNGFVDTNGLWHLDTTNEHNGQDDKKDINGGIITGSNNTSSGGGVSNQGTFNMYGGNIVGNTALNGGGVNNQGTFNMYGGNITGNIASGNGGGVYTSYSSGIILTGGNITGNITSGNGGGVYYRAEMCLAPGTLITMGDGTRQTIETLSIGDIVRVFDHEKGEISSSKIYDVWTYPEKHSGQVKLHFSNNIDVTVVYGHSFFEYEQNKYVAVTMDNVSTFVGHKFYNVDNGSWETLEGYDLIDGEVDTYVITTEYHLNCIVNGMLSNEDGFYSMMTNIFDYGDNLKIDADKKESDIAQYGIYEFENLKYVSIETYDMLNFQYLNVAFGKGLITPEAFAYLEAYWTGVDPELFCDENKETPDENKPNLLKAPLKSSPNLSPVPSPTEGFYVGGSIKILENSGGNLYLSSGKEIIIGTGTVGDGNGVVTPTGDMKIGITLQDTVGKFTSNVTKDYSSNFVSDNDDYSVWWNDNSLIISGHIHNGIKFTKWTQSNSLPDEAGNYVLGGDITLSSTWNVPVGTTNLCLNGYVIKLVGNSTESVIKVPQNATLNLYDCGTTVHNGYVGTDGLWHLDANNEHQLGENETSKEITGGIITGGNNNSTIGNGGGLQVDKGEFNMYGGNIVGNYAKHGAGVQVSSATEAIASFKMSGGEIKYNKAYLTGGGVSVGNKNVVFTMTGGEITKNVAETTVLGGGVFTQSDITLGGTAQITGNTAKNGDNNVCLLNDIKITISGESSPDGMSIGVSSYNLSSQVVLGAIASNGTEEDTKYFFSDNDSYKACFNNNGTDDVTTDDYLELKDAYLITNNTNEDDKETNHGYIDVDKNAVEDERVVVTVDPNEGYKLSSLKYNDGTNDYNITATNSVYSFTMPAKAVSITATFSRTMADTPSYPEHSGPIYVHHHSLEEVSSKLPTCIEDGYKTAYYCLGCKKYFKDSLGENEIGDLTAYNAWKVNEGRLQGAHKASKIDGVSPTQDESGYKDAWKCTECNKYFEDSSCTKLIGDENAYNNWKANDGYLQQLPKEESNEGAIVGICIGSLFLLLIIVYILCYFFLYREGILDDKKVKVIYKFLPRGNKNLKETK